jgi:3-oxoacyl-[acyl-carrier protein] reductase
MGNAGQVNYAAAKAGLIGMTKALAKEAGSRGVRANAIAPGYIVTDMTAGLSDDIKEQLTGHTPLGRLGTPEDVAGLVAFLCTDAASFITGTVIPVDGGLAM